MPDEPPKIAMPAETGEGLKAADASSPASAPQADESGAKDKMEIHHPDKPIHSKKDFIIHMLTVVLGILIALGFEAMVQWGHHRALVREAKANLATEIAHNRKTLDDAMPEILKRKENLEKIRDYLQHVEKGETIHGNFSYGYSLFDLYATAWKTAETSGATAYMSYDELKNYTELYDLQQIFQSFQSDAFHNVVDMSGLPAVMGEAPAKVPPAVLRDMETLVSKGLVINDVVAKTATQLKQQYDGFQGHQ